MLWGIYSAIYVLLVHRCEKRVEIKGDYVEKIGKLFYFCHLKKLVRPETFGPYHVHSISLDVQLPQYGEYRFKLILWKFKTQ